MQHTQSTIIADLVSRLHVCNLFPFSVDSATGYIAKNIVISPIKTNVHMR